MKYNKSITATVYVINDDRVLLHEHKKYHTWFPLGGHIESDEFPYEAAIREVKEESGFNVTLGHEENFFDFIYIAETKETEPHPEGNESQKFKWFTYEELLEYEIKPHVKNTALAVLDYYRKLDKANTV